jgi:hypothetical protein
MREYTQVGIVDVEVARAMPTDDQIVAVEANAVGPDQRILARPKRGNDE